MTKIAPPAVLVVEDEPLTRMVAADAISDTGIQVREAADAEEALEVLDNHSEIGVLFTDIDMPGPLDGLDLAEQVHEDRPEVELIVTSGASTVQDSDLPDSGTFLHKPYRTTRLVEIVREKVASRSGGSDSSGADN
jgi:DNA-binding NtrC family response regulator